MATKTAALVLAALTAGMATAADGDFTITGSRFSIDKDVMECTSACVLRFKGKYQFSIGHSFPNSTAFPVGSDFSSGGNVVKASVQRFFIGSSQFEISRMFEMTSLPDGFFQLKAEAIRMTKVPSAL